MNINRKKIPACFLSFMALSLFSDVASAQVGSVDMAGVGDMLRRLVDILPRLKAGEDVNHATPLLRW